MESHLAGCSACRGVISEIPSDTSLAGPVPARFVARARTVWQRWHVDHAAPVPALSGAPALPLRRATPAWAVVAASAAAGLLGGVVAVRWLEPDARVTLPVAQAAQNPAVAGSDAAKDLARRQGALEAKTADLERRLAERRPTGDAGASAVKDLSLALDAVRRDVAALGDIVRSQPAPAAGAPAKDAVPLPDLPARLDRLQAELVRLDTGLAEIRRANELASRELADARQAQDRTAERLSVLETRSVLPTAPVALAVVTDYDALFAAARQGTREDYQQALETLGSQKLDTLGLAVAYYSKDAPKDRRSLAGDELNRKGAKGVDHDLILCLAHDHLAVRREAAVHLAKYRTRGQDFGFIPSALPEERQRGLLKAIRWWENEYRDDYPEKTRFQAGAVIMYPVGGAKPVTPAPAAGTPPPASTPPVPPQYNPPK
jgi:hypothetical protein